jgi:hypothetical protein
MGCYDPAYTTPKVVAYQLSTRTFRADYVTSFRRTSPPAPTR